MDTSRHPVPDVRGLSRAELENLALKNYASGDLSDEEARRLLGFQTQFKYTPCSRSEACTSTTAWRIEKKT